MLWQNPCEQVGSVHVGMVHILQMMNLHCAGSLCKEISRVFNSARVCKTNPRSLETISMSQKSDASRQ